MMRSDSQQARQRAVALYQEGRFAEAVAVLDDALASAPDFWRLWVMKSMLCADARQDHAALQAAERACALEPASAAAWAARANALWRLGRPWEGLDAVERAIALDPSIPDLYGIKADLLSSQHDDQGALACLEQALQRATGDMLALVLGRKAGILDRLGDLHEALATLEAAQRLPDLLPITRAGLWIAQAEACERHRRWAEAEAAYQRALAAAPAHVGALRGLVNVQTHLRHWLATLASVRSVEHVVAEEGGARSEVRYLAAKVLRHMHRPVEALAILEEFVAAHPDRLDPLALRGWVLMDLRRSAEALADFERALAALPTWRWCLVGKWRALVRLHRWHAAWITFQQYMRVPPTSG